MSVITNDTYEYDFICFHILHHGETAFTGFNADNADEAEAKCIKEFGNCDIVLAASDLMSIVIDRLKQQMRGG